ncbi:DUF92 domain-containing protein [Pseudalkalibacillus caeni]|uniref:DUF92 domain-containing protein n=1 Tax=Exobacillus caeni TaxID=2574798 RepID=A0A5R9F661_9BACL|nr:DUF92 domain-containing protein [Pseudalkalibacillus caeni]TLS36313.1 DUF92 domain-containing protein [Pseudalkalibacillus caeni]
MLGYALTGVLAAAAAGYLSKALSFSGFVATVIVGACISASFGIKGVLLIGAFFVSSTIWSKYKEKQKEKNVITEKGSRRDIFQVMANGGIAAVASLGLIFFPSPVWTGVFVASIAGSNADTWASELGVLSKGMPLSLRGFIRVQPGTSGAVSPFGTVAALAGSLFIGGIAAFLFKLSLPDAIILAVAGFIGNLIDTFFGAFFQITYKCEKCGIESEKRFHCETRTSPVKGYYWLNNDTVNLLSSLLAGVIGGLALL